MFTSYYVQINYFIRLVCYYILYILYSDYDFTNDAISLSRYSLKNLLKEIYLSMGNPNYDNYTKAHLSNSAEMIETILNAEKQIH